MAGANENLHSASLCICAWWGWDLSFPTTKNILSSQSRASV